MTVIGLTGGFGTGKTFVASIFGRLGARIIDADRLSQDAVKKGSAAYSRIIDAFGEGILSRAGDIDREKLAGIVFRDRMSLERLNRIIHPEVIGSIRRSIERAKKRDIIVIDAPLLVEANLTGMADYVVVVTASRRTQIERCRRKFHISGKEVLGRIRNQVPMKRKVELSDFVIDNDGSRKETIRQANKIWKEIIWK